MMLVSLISYIDRNTIAILAPQILRETHMTAERYGYIISCFSIAYMLANPAWGRLLDRWGVRRGMTTAVGVWSIAAMAHAWATGFLSFGIARAVLGAGEGATFPGGLRTVTQTLEPDKRGRGLAIAYSGGSLGAIVTPFIVTPIALRFGWHGAFLVTGALGFLWLILWGYTGRGVDKAAGYTKAKLPWGHPALWAYIAIYALGALPIGFIIYDSSLYLHARFHWDQAMLGKVLWLPPLGWEIGYFAWGAILDRVGPRFRGLFLACLALCLPIAAMHSLPTPALVLADMVLAMFALGGIVVVSVTYATRSFSQDHAGWLSGIGAGSWGAMVALTSPLFGRLFDAGRYQTACIVAAAFPVVGWALWRILDGRSNDGKSVPQRDLG